MKLRHYEYRTGLRNFTRHCNRTMIESAKDFDYEEQRREKGLPFKKRKRKKGRVGGWDLRESNKDKLGFEPKQK